SSPQTLSNHATGEGINSASPWAIAPPSQKLYITRGCLSADGWKDYLKAGCEKAPSQTFV
ncbi:TPA: hypothetical protein ACWLAK_004707, partial [Escherichia coli]